MMSRLHVHPESHLVDRMGWLRAAVRANDGIVSTASLIVGVAAASAKPSEIRLPELQDLWPGRCRWPPANMLGQFQSDTEHADLARERKELSENVEFEREE